LIFIRKVFSAIFIPLNSMSQPSKVAAAKKNTSDILVNVSFFQHFGNIKLQIVTENNCNELSIDQSQFADRSWVAKMTFFSHYPLIEFLMLVFSMLEFSILENIIFKSFVCSNLSLRSFLKFFPLYLFQFSWTMFESLMFESLMFESLMFESSISKLQM